MKNRIITWVIITASVVFLSAGMVFHSPTTVIPGLENKLEDYYRLYPQQKVYLHLDKLAYLAGEKIWYRAYLVDARSHKPDTISKNLVVELINSYGNTSLIQLLKLENGFASGDFHIPDTISEGLYQIRAYTNWMRNFGDEYFFRREINIWNPGYYTQQYREDKLASKRHKRKSSRKARKLDVQFFPEGGYLIAGVNSVLGFKAVNDLGLGVPVSGSIYDKKKNRIAEFSSSHYGMGTFSFTPEEGRSYRAEVELPGGKLQHFKLPEVKSSGYYLKLEGNDRNGLRLRTGSTLENPLVLFACHMRGELLFTTEVRPRPAGTVIEIPTGDFPSGILHITLFDTQRKPRCERLAFIHSDDMIELSIRKDKAAYGKMEPVQLTLMARDNEGRPVQGTFSLSVSDRDLENSAADFQSGMVSTLLLSSDITGRIEQADYYFRDRNAETRQALDILLLTQGWRRFDWDDIINEVPKEIEYPIQKGLLVRGKVTKEFLDIPLKNLPVTLTVLSEFNDVFITRSDHQGQFEFELPDYEDTLQVEITSRRLSGRKNLAIYLEEDNLEESDQIYSSYTSEMTVMGTNVFRPFEEQKQDTMKPTLEGIYHEPDYVLYVDEQMGSYYSSVLEMIRGRIAGVTVVGNSVQIRGPSTFVGSNEPLYLIDNVQTDVGAVQSLNPSDVERIEVLKGPSAAIYGSRGGNGVIAIFTKRGRFQVKGVYSFEMLGYHRPREFYSPVYGTEFDDLVIDNRSSLYWNPEITTDKNGNAQIRFFNSDKLSTFYVVAEGISPTGSIGRAEKTYEVR